MSRRFDVGASFALLIKIGKVGNVGGVPIEKSIFIRIHRNVTCKITPSLFISSYVQIEMVSGQYLSQLPFCIRYQKLSDYSFNKVCKQPNPAIASNVWLPTRNMRHKDSGTQYQVPKCQRDEIAKEHNVNVMEYLSIGNVFTIFQLSTQIECSDYEYSMALTPSPSDISSIWHSGIRHCVPESKKARVV